MNIEKQTKIAGIIQNAAITGGSLFFAFMALTLSALGPLLFITSVVLLITSANFGGLTPGLAFVLGVGVLLAGIAYSRLGTNILKG